MESGFEFLTTPIVNVWSGQLRRAKDAKKRFTDRGAQVMQFYSGDPGFMWKDDYVTRYMGGSALQPPKFQVTLNKAFEFIAVMGPMLFWDMADRSVKPYRPMDLDIQTLAGRDEMRLQFLSEMQDLQAANNASNEMRSAIQERVLNYLPRVQPSGGLVTHAGMAVFDALLKGAGFLSTESYRFPGSNKKLVGSFWISVDDVLVDPDCRSPLWNDASWVAIRHRHKYFEVEDYFGLPPGSMRKYCSETTAGAKWLNDAPPREIGPGGAEKEAKDVIVWYEIFSKAGVGNKLAGTKERIEPIFDEDAGDYAYLCICPLCPYPLNFPADLLGSDAAGADDGSLIRERFRWPTEYWRDNKWPLNRLMFYPHATNSPWPEPPLAPALGELTVLNILISAYVQTVYDNRQQFLAVFDGMIQNLQEVLNSSKSPSVITLTPGIHKSINDVIQFMNRPEINKDVPKTIEFLLGLFEQRTGMSQILYGGAGDTNSRSATEYSGRRETVNIRPDYMRKKVGEWMSETAAKELFAVYSHMGTEDVADILGPLATMAWEQLVQNEDADVVLRSSECFVEASDIARPNHERELQILRDMTQYYMPVLAGYMAQTGNPDPLNGFTQAIADASNMDARKWLIPKPSSPDEASQLSQKIQQQLELQKLQAEVAKIMADSRKLDAEAQATSARIQTEQMNANAKMLVAQRIDQAKELEQSFRLQSAQQAADLKLAAAEHAAELKRQELAHTAALREHEAELKAMQAEHQTSLREREADASAHVVAAQAAAKQQSMEMANANQIDASQMQMQRHHQSMQEREQAATQKMMLDLIQKQQQMRIADAGHAQQMDILDEKSAADARRANLINENRLLMHAAMAQMRAKTGSQVSA